MLSQDNILIKEIKKGDLNAYKELFYKYLAPLQTYALKFVKTPEIAEEIVHDLFVAIWNKRNEIEITVSAKSYLYTSIRNRCISKLRQNKMHLQSIDNEKEYFNESEIIINMSQENGLSAIIAEELEDKLMAAIDNLPKRCKEIFIMSRFEGLKQKEIAHEMRLSINTIEKQISRALQKIRNDLKPYLSLLFICILNISCSFI